MNFSVNHKIYCFAKTYEENLVFTLVQKTRPDIITIFGRVRDIHPCINSLQFSAILPQKIRAIEILRIFIIYYDFVDIYHFGNY